jgi:hypothetical protein
MGMLRRRLERLEAADATTQEWSVPPEVNVHLKAVARYRASEEGKEPPPYTREELEEMRRQDLETVAGGYDDHREGPGWQSEEAQRFIDS